MNAVSAIHQSAPGPVPWDAFVCVGGSIQSNFLVEFNRLSKTKRILRLLGGEVGAKFIFFGQRRVRIECSGTLICAS